MTLFDETPPSSAPRWFIIRADGAARGNPGPAGIGAVLRDERGETVVKLSKYIGRATNNEAEYQAIIMALEAAVQLGATAVHLYIDSELLARQLQGQYRVKSPNLQPLYRRAFELLRRFSPALVTHVTRDGNREADALANKAIDEALRRH